jgi:hypothetical protein
MATLRRSAVAVTLARRHLDEVVVKVNGWLEQTNLRAARLALRRRSLDEEVAAFGVKRAEPVSRGSERSRGVTTSKIRRHIAAPGSALGLLTGNPQ